MSENLEAIEIRPAKFPFEEALSNTFEGFTGASVKVLEEVVKNYDSISHDTLFEKYWPQIEPLIKFYLEKRHYKDVKIYEIFYETRGPMVDNGLHYHKVILIPTVIYIPDPHENSCECVSLAKMSGDAYWFKIFLEEVLDYIKERGDAQ